LVNVSKLKIDALDIQDKMNTVRWIKRRRLRRKLMTLLDEIENEEGRLKYAN
jgi:hypothetical protein